MPAFAAAKTHDLTRKQKPQVARLQRTMKQAIDVVGASLLLALSAPLVFVLAMRIKLHDGGPVFFRRRVVGPRGEFNALKLRTMRVDAEEVLRRDTFLRRQFEVNFKLKDDPRVTSVGTTLRRSGLDELPQLWNVLKGEMSLVGPRMITTVELKKYRDAAWIFSEMKPGLTGYWQTSGDQMAGYDRRIEMDLFYAENWSLLFDLKILIKTPSRVLRGSGV
ncbi:MAG TPA: sugar transferase [Candidatus Binatia bacterium]|nr:sugar transferase [Candidatus Binatia bacterium]